MLTLYQFAISHFCEKVRWTLDYKQLDYRVKNLLPGLHSLTTKKLAPNSSVPILVHDDRVIQGASHIITYLELAFPQRSLMPENQVEQTQVMEWEAYADREIAPHVRCCCYHSLLERPDLLIPLFSHGGPWYGKLYVKASFPKLQSKMRSLMNINQTSARNAKQQLLKVVEKLQDHLQERTFLVGSGFSRADLAVAALLAPIYRPKKYGVAWPDHMPEALLTLAQELDVQRAWIEQMYAQYR